MAKQMIWPPRNRPSPENAPADVKVREVHEKPEAPVQAGETPPEEKPGDTRPADSRGSRPLKTPATPAPSKEE